MDMTSGRPLIVALGLVVAVGCSQTGGPREPSTTVSADSASIVSMAARESATSDRPRVVFLGDSLTAGLGLASEDSVPSLIQVKLDEAGYPYHVVNAGVSGDTSAGGLSRFEWSLEGDVAILVIELGGNDGLRGLPPPQMKRNIDEIIRRAKARGIAVILTGMEAQPNFGAPYTAEFRQVFGDLAEEHGVGFVPFFLEGVAGIEELNQDDGIHPNAQGARIVAETVWRALEPALQAQDR